MVLVRRTEADFIPMRCAVRIEYRMGGLCCLFAMQLTHHLLVIYLLCRGCVCVLCVYMMVLCWWSHFVRLHRKDDLTVVVVVNRKLESIHKSMIFKCIKMNPIVAFGRTENLSLTFNINLPFGWTLTVRTALVFEPKYDQKTENLMFVAMNLKPMHFIRRGLLTIVDVDRKLE